MTEPNIITYNGVTDKKYVFTIYNLYDQKDEIAAVYIVARSQPNPPNPTILYPIYIGETDNLKSRFENHHKQECFKLYKADKLCVHREDIETIRKTIENDLLQKWDPPCNDQ